MANRMKDYPGLYAKAKEQVRLTGINPRMPGYEMLIKAIVIYKVDGKEDLFQKVSEDGSVVPIQTELREKLEKKNRHPVEQVLIEAMKSIGVDYEDVIYFIEELASDI